MTEQEEGRHRRGRERCGRNRVGRGLGKIKEHYERGGDQGRVTLKRGRAEIRKGGEG